jgi:hypothetical protein
LIHPVSKFWSWSTLYPKLFLPPALTQRFDAFISEFWTNGQLLNWTTAGTFKWINQQDAATSQVCYLLFKYSSTCFGHPHAHHQELQLQ